jgi:acyl-CoA synthetase (AMP-forming)/AMP-acid ligase II
MASRGLLAWLHDPVNDRGIHFARRGKDWDFWTYPRLASLACKAAWGLVETGVREGDVICLILRSGPEFVATFFGAMLAGAIPCPVAPEMAFQDPGGYAEHISTVFETARPSKAVTQRDLLSGIPPSAKETGGHQMLVFDELLSSIDTPPGFPVRRLADFAMMQFTSGSSAPGRGVKVPFEALEANVEAIRRWLHWTEDDSFASWLPLHHDMGLVGALICSVVGGSDLWLLEPEHFIRNPLRYLQCFGEFGATLTVTATFGLDYILRKIQTKALEGLDFSGWQGMVVGAERIDARSLDEFFKLLSPFGFRRRVLLPAYGMAEATLAITGLPLDEEWTGVAVESSSLSLGRKVVTYGAGNGGHVVVGCGRPLEGLAIAITDDENRPLPDLTVGEIVVRGTSVAAGYLQDSDASALTQFSDGVLRTGDAGFMSDGQLFVLGRLGDSMKVRGRVVFGEDLEVALAGIGVPRERLAVLLGLYRGSPTAVVVIEKFQNRWQAQVEAIVRYYAPDAAVVLVDGPKGSIGRTSSGKPKRRLLWSAFVAGNLPGRIVGPQATSFPVTNGR